MKSQPSFWQMIRAAGKLLRWIGMDQSTEEQSMHREASDFTLGGGPIVPAADEAPLWPATKPVQATAAMPVVKADRAPSPLPERPKPEREHFAATEVVHRIYVEGHVYLVLSDAEWYDTASPWRYCAAQLSQLDAFVATTPVQIESFGEIHLIDGPDALLLWVERVFERTYPQGFGHMLRGRRAKNSGE